MRGLNCGISSLSCVSPALRALLLCVCLDRTRKVSKKGIYRGLIIGTRKEVGRLDGSYISMANNRCLMLDRTTEKFVGSRVDGPICKELRANKQKEIKYKQIISFSGGAL